MYMVWHHGDHQKQLIWQMLSGNQRDGGKSFENCHNTTVECQNQNTRNFYRVLKACDLNKSNAVFL